MSPIITDILMFIPICLITAVVCTVLKKEEGEPVIGPIIKMFLMLSVGIALFCVVIFLVTVFAGSEFTGVW